MMRSWWVLGLCLLPTVARAGGFEFPDNGTEALGRGGAFTAKADSALALQYNVAGLAQIRGTTTVLDGNLSIHSYDFTRSGNYPGTATADQPWAGQAFPKVSNQGGPFFAPFLGITTDFNYFKKWTFALGAYGPSSYGSRSFPATLPNGFPSPARYDITNENLLIIYPTLAAAYQINKYIEIGLALHLVIATFDLSNVSSLNLGTCKVAEDPQCDTNTHIKTSGFTATGSIGALVHPIKGLSIGMNLKGPVYLDTSGTVEATAPPNMAQAIGTIPAAPARFLSNLPWVLRLGVRWAFFSKNDGFEAGDIEVDGTYEAWSAAEGVGSKVLIPQLYIFSDVNPVITHQYKDTFGVRLGGSYNARLPQGVLTLRLGFYFDSASTTYRYTRLDFDTGAKYAPTFGVGYKIRGVTINLAYAFIYEPQRIVTDGDVRIINGVNGTFVDPNGNPTGVVNNGTYQAQTHVLSIGLKFEWDELIRTKRWKAAHPDASAPVASR